MSVAARECVLLIEGNTVDARLISEALTNGTPNAPSIECVAKLHNALERIRQGGVRALILDIELPNGKGVATFEGLRCAARHIPILILSGTENENVARQAVERGAQDYLLKSQLRTSRLRTSVQRMIERSTAEEKAFLRQQGVELILSCTGDAVLIADSAGWVTHLNPAAEAVLGWSQQEAQGRTVGEVFSVVVNTGQPVEDALGISTDDMEQVRRCANYTLLRRDGVEVAITSSTARIRDLHGNAAGAVAVFHDVGTAWAKTVELSHLAQHDFLTDLPNRLLLKDRINQAIAFATRYNKQLSVMFVDLDHFKKINDTFGHVAGDKLLQSVAARIVACVRRSDTVSRQGGDEFVVLLSQVGHAEDTVFIARKILSSLAAPYSIDQKHMYIKASIGVSTYPGDGQDAETLIHRADTAMYDAKKLGRNNCQFFRSDMQARVLEWQSLEGNLRSALSRDEFVLHYQPKIDLKTAEISGVEALLRWKHPDRGLIQPVNFVPIAEESGLIVPIGQWVLREACRQARTWIDAGLPPVRIAINVSAVEFMAQDFLSGVRAALISTGVDPHYLELELTETVLMHDADSTIQTLTALKDIGVQLAIDDFGTGYSSFSYLRKFPLDSLKVDRSFINEILPDSDNATILSALINIGKSLKHRVVAEGVETLEQLHFLQKEGCTEGQGYFFCHPVIAEKFAEFLETGVREAAVH